MDELYATMDSQTASHTYFEPSDIDEILKTKLHDPFGGKISRKQNEVEGLDQFKLMTEKPSLQPRQGNTICLPTLNEGSHRQVIEVPGSFIT